MTNTKTILIGLSTLGVILILMFGVPIYHRYQVLQDESNKVQVNEIRIRQQEQLIQVEKQKAEIRVQEAYGIAKSQEIISGSLNLNYLQYLAIQAQEKMAESPNHSTIYIPSGNNGIPLIKTVD
jgi:hypothetical protein